MVAEGLAKAIGPHGRNSFKPPAQANRRIHGHRYCFSTIA
jgi:hypothetical protein